MEFINYGGVGQFPLSATKRDFYCGEIKWITRAENEVRKMIYDLGQVWEAEEKVEGRMIPKSGPRSEAKMAKTLNQSSTGSRNRIAKAIN